MKVADTHVTEGPKLSSVEAATENFHSALKELDEERTTLAKGALGNIKRGRTFGSSVV